MQRDRGTVTDRGGRTRRRAGAAFLVLQLSFIGAARFTESRYYCWAPFHSEARYSIDATLEGRTLDDAEIARRYSLPRLYWDEPSRTDWELNSITHIIDMIRAKEASVPQTDRAEVVLTYRVNGRASQHWYYP